MLKKRIHVTTIARDSWRVVKEGDKRAVSVFPTRYFAIKKAKEYLSLGYDVVIHDKFGTVVEWIKGDE